MSDLRIEYRKLKNLCSVLVALEKEKHRTDMTASNKIGLINLQIRQFTDIQRMVARQSDNVSYHALYHRFSSYLKEGVQLIYSRIEELEHQKENFSKGVSFLPIFHDEEYRFMYDIIKTEGYIDMHMMEIVEKTCNKPQYLPLIITVLFACAILTENNLYE